MVFFHRVALIVALRRKPYGKRFSSTSGMGDGWRVSGTRMCANTSNTLTLEATDKQTAHEEAEKRQKEELPTRENSLLAKFLNDFWSDSGAYAKLKEIRAS